MYSWPDSRGNLKGDSASVWSWSWTYTLWYLSSIPKYQCFSAASFSVLTLWRDFSIYYYTIASSSFVLYPSQSRQIDILNLFSIHMLGTYSTNWWIWAKWRTFWKYSVIYNTEHDGFCKSIHSSFVCFFAIFNKLKNKVAHYACLPAVHFCLDNQIRLIFHSSLTSEGESSVSLFNLDVISLLYLVCFVHFVFAKWCN